MHLPEQALAEYEFFLPLMPNRFNALYGAAQAADSSGDRSKAQRYFQQLVDNCRQAESERPELRQARLFLARRSAQQ